jgi:hypothetical protein
MNDNYISMPADDSRTKLYAAFSDPRLKETINMIRVALSLGSVIAGGAAMHIYDSAQVSYLRPSYLRDVDLWFPTVASLDAFLMANHLRGFVLTPSFGGNAYDVHIPNEPQLLQIVKFRVGSPIEIISEFDFVNSAIAFDGSKFWMHRDFPSLRNNGVLRLQTNNSRFFLSRVDKYVRKGLIHLDINVQERLISEIDALADKTLCDEEHVRIFDRKFFSASELEAAYFPHRKSLRKAEGVIQHFVSSAATNGWALFDRAQVQSFDEKLARIRNVLTSIGAQKKETAKLSGLLEYGY